jgi:hypothetical protein
VLVHQELLITNSLNKKISVDRIRLTTEYIKVMSGIWGKIMLNLYLNPKHARIMDRQGTAQILAAVDDE